MSCKHYEFQSSLFGGDYTCIIKGKSWDERKTLDSGHYIRYCRSDYDFRDCPIYISHYASSGPCFITTMACEILGLPDNHEVLNTLRAFRDNVLQKNKKYTEILKVYDAIGPMVADSIRNDENREQIALDLYKSSLLPIVEEIKNNNHTRAIKHYLYMTLFLVSEYNLRNTYNALKEVDFGFANFDQAKAGHGRKLARGTSE